MQYIRRDKLASRNSKLTRPSMNKDYPKQKTLVSNRQLDEEEIDLLYSAPPMQNLSTKKAKPLSMSDYKRFKHVVTIG